MVDGVLSAKTDIWNKPEQRCTPDAFYVLYQSVFGHSVFLFKQISFCSLVVFKS
jgi:hypothetical protein